MINVRISKQASVLQGRIPPEEGRLVGYGAIIKALDLETPAPSLLSLISDRHRKYLKEGWQVFGPRYDPGQGLFEQLRFAFKYEGVELLVLKKLFEELKEKEVLGTIGSNPKGKYARKLFFLYEWSMGRELPIPNADPRIRYTPIVDPELQYALNEKEGERWERHRVIDNLPGTRDFCPLVRRSQRMKAYEAKKLSEREERFLSGNRKERLHRAASLLLSRESIASFRIDGEDPESKRATLWAQAVREAGSRPPSQEGLLRAQRTIIESDRFTRLGLRNEGAFVGMEDPSSGRPLPDHIAPPPRDLQALLGGLIHTERRLESSTIDPVPAAASIAFGFVFIRPFQDGNGRIHRYLIHQVLARKGFFQQGSILPLSSSILEQVDRYLELLGTHSRSLLERIDWRSDPNGHIEVLNDPKDLYRYFDATPFAEFLAERIEDTVERIVPQELEGLERYDRLKSYLEEAFEMPDRRSLKLFRALEQGGGKLSDKARGSDLPELTDDEVLAIEERYSELLHGEEGSEESSRPKDPDRSS
jgi:hypothetical protein